jgi:hypothetical protein
MSSSARGKRKAAKAGAAVQPAASLDPDRAGDWMRRWRQNILGKANRPCDQEMGEQIGWRVTPFLNGFYHGYMATGDREWVYRLLDWGDAVVRRGVKEPDGFIGWPRAEDADVLEYLPRGMKLRYTDTQLGDAMFLRPMVLMAGEILRTPALRKEYGRKAMEYLRLSETMFDKWNSRGTWRETDEGGIWVVPPFGLDPKTRKWAETDGYKRRKTDGNSLPANKENLIALWLIAMYDVTHKPIYRERAEMWWRGLRSRMRLRENGKYFVWNYWDAVVPWDTNPDGSIKHWVGVHPNGGYYAIDVTAIVAAYEHGLVFTREDIARLIATNRDFMWNQQIENAQFRRIDGGRPDPRWAKTPGVLWAALAPYDPTLWKIFAANHDPESWGGLSTPQWVARFSRKPQAAR